MLLPSVLFYPGAPGHELMPFSELNCDDEYVRHYRTRRVRLDWLGSSRQTSGARWERAWRSPPLSRSVNSAAPRTQPSSSGSDQNSADAGGGSVEAKDLPRSMPLRHYNSCSDRCRNEVPDGQGSALCRMPRGYSARCTQDFCRVPFAHAPSLPACGRGRRKENRLALILDADSDLTRVGLLVLIRSRSPVAVHHGSRGCNPGFFSPRQSVAQSCLIPRSPVKGIPVKFY